MGKITRTLALVEIGRRQPRLRRALRQALDGLSVAQADSLEVAFGFAIRVVLVVGEAADPVEQVRGCARERLHRLLIACERAEGSEVARWVRAGLTNCFVGEGSFVELRERLVSSAAPVVVLDASDLAIEIAGMRTRLTRTQFQLFQHLSRKSGDWVKPSELVRQALGTHHQDEAALVRVHIHAIRRALGPLAPVIETDPTRARGYRFRTDLADAGISTEGCSPVGRRRAPLSG